MFVRVSSCHYQTYYYVGFAYMMLRRYSDATKAFANILLFISRTKQLQHRSSVYDQLQKKADQMYALLTICIALSPTRLDDSIHSVLREKYGEQLSKLPKGGDRGELDDAILEELFLFACPKFINPIPPDWDQPEGIADPTAHHLQVFKIMVKSEGVVGTLRSYLKLYKSIEIGKLAGFLGVEKDVLRELLLVFKTKAKQVRWEDGPGKGGLLKGETVKLTDLDFGIDNVSSSYKVFRGLTIGHGQYFRGKSWSEIRGLVHPKYSKGISIYKLF
jgi:translation initiation factor 3 subunit L